MCLLVQQFTMQTGLHAGSMTDAEQGVPSLLSHAHALKHNTACCSSQLSVVQKFMRLLDAGPPYERISNAPCMKAHDGTSSGLKTRVVSVQATARLGVL